MSPVARKTLLILGLWSFYGVLISIHTHYRFRIANRPISWSEAFFAECAYALIWAALTPAVLWLGARTPITRQNWSRTGSYHFLASLAFGAASKALWMIVALPYVHPAKVPKTAAQWRDDIIFSLDYGFLNYALVLVFYYAAEYYHRYEEGRVKAAQLEAQLARAQLQALKMQLHPHFLFNSLHAISELIHEDKEGAERMIARLSEFLRLTLEQAAVQEVTLRQELDFLERYLEIEKMRFEDRLHVHFQIDPAALEAKVPNLILQPLVENALRHGLSDRASNGVVQVECRREDATLWMKVFDNGSGVPLPHASQQGVGLANTRERLERLYGDEYQLSLVNVPSGGFQVMIRIPFHP